MKRDTYNILTNLFFVLFGGASMCLPHVPLFVGTALAQTETAPSGSGTSGDPHLISSLDNLAWLQDAANDSAWGDYFVQTANIDASPTSGWNSGKGLSPIGKPSANFVGTYDGGGYTISNLFIFPDTTATAGVGLFGDCHNAIIKNAALINENVKGWLNVGGLAGTGSACTFDSCYTTGSVYGSSGYIGGLVGYLADYSGSPGAIRKSYSDARVSTYQGLGVGGVVGWVETSSVSSLISNSYGTGSVIATGSSSQLVGGFVGFNRDAAISDCYAVGSVTGSSSVGGFVGDNYNFGTITNCFWDTDSSGSTGVGSGFSDGVTGETSANMQSSTIFTNAGWDFTSTWSISGVVNNGYPNLSGATDVSLPVQAADFIATTDVGSVTLSWKTQSEVDNAGFVVEKEPLGVSIWQLAGSYTSVKSLVGLGTSTTGRAYQFTDDHVASGTTYTYKIQSVSTNGTTKDLTTLTVTVDVPKSYALYQNYPNPFNPSTTIRFDLKEGSSVTLEIYNALGQRVMEQEYGTMNAGRYDESIDMSRFASGMYFYRVTAIGNDGAKFMSIKKLILMK